MSVTSELSKVMLFSATPPGEGSVGENFLRALVKAVPARQLCAFTPWSRKYAVWKPSAELTELSMLVQPLPNELLTNFKRGSIADQLVSIIRRPQYWSQLRAVEDAAVQFGLDNGVNRVLSVLASPSIIAMTRNVCRRLNAKLSTLVWDPPQSTMHNFGFDPITTRFVMNEFHAALQLSDQCMVSSEYMSEDFFGRLGVSSQVLARPILDAERIEARPPARKDRFTIGFCGSMYADATFYRLLVTLKERNWTIGGKPAVLRTMGNCFRMPIEASGSPCEVEYLGHRSIVETARLMAECDAAYLPYWFDPQFALSVRNCLPDKLITYIGAGVPVLYHGPADSTVVRLIERYPVGLACPSGDVAVIAEKLEQIASDGSIRATAYEAGQAARREYFNPEIFQQRVRRLCGISADAAAVLDDSKTLTTQR